MARRLQQVNRELFLLFYDGRARRHTYTAARWFAYRVFQRAPNVQGRESKHANRIRRTIFNRVPRSIFWVFNVLYLSYVIGLSTLLFRVPLTHRENINSILKIRKIKLWCVLFRRGKRIKLFVHLQTHFNLGPLTVQ